MQAIDAALLQRVVAAKASSSRGAERLAVRISDAGGANAFVRGISEIYGGVAADSVSWEQLSSYLDQAGFHQNSVAYLESSLREASAELAQMDTGNALGPPLSPPKERVVGEREKCPHSSKSERAANTKDDEEPLIDAKKKPRETADSAMGGDETGPPAPPQLERPTTARVRSRDDGIDRRMSHVSLQGGSSESESDSGSESGSKSSSGGEDPRAPPAGSALAAVRARAGASESKAEPPEAQTYVSTWSAADRLDSKPHGDATKQSNVEVRIYGAKSRLQSGCAPDLKPGQDYYDFAGPEQLTRLQAQKAGGAVQRTDPLIDMPHFGGCRRVAIDEEVSMGAVGVHKGSSAASAAGRDALERKRQQNRAGKQRAGGALPTFNTWMIDEEPSAGKRYTSSSSAAVLDDMKARAAAKGHAGEVMTKDLLSYILNPTQKKRRKKPYLVKQKDASNWCAKWD